MSKERFDKFQTSFSGKDVDPIAYDRFSKGWDQALDSEAVKKLVEALSNMKSVLNIALEDTADLYYANVLQDVNEALEEFNKAKSQGDGE